MAEAGFGGLLLNPGWLPDIDKHCEKTKIKDSHNDTKIGASDIFGGNQLRFRISAQ